MKTFLKKLKIKRNHRQAILLCITVLSTLFIFQNCKVIDDPNWLREKQNEMANKEITFEIDPIAQTALTKNICDPKLGYFKANWTLLQDENIIINGHGHCQGHDFYATATGLSEIQCGEHYQLFINLPAGYKATAEFFYPCGEPGLTKADNINFCIYKLDSHSKLCEELCLQNGQSYQGITEKQHYCSEIQ